MSVASERMHLHPTKTSHVPHKNYSLYYLLHGKPGEEDDGGKSRNFGSTSSALEWFSGEQNCSEQEFGSGIADKKRFTFTGISRKIPATSLYEVAFQRKLRIDILLRRGNTFIRYVLGAFRLTLLLSNIWLNLLMYM